MKSKTLACVVALLAMALVCPGMQAHADVGLCAVAAPAPMLAPVVRPAPAFAAPQVALDLASAAKPAAGIGCSLPTFCTGLGTCACPNQTCSKGICR